MRCRVIRVFHTKKPTLWVFWKDHAIKLVIWLQLGLPQLADFPYPFADS